jgi:lipoprotein-anchoring transpeptidase ErfK/SrfK
VGNGNVSSNATLPFVAVPASTEPDDVHPTYSARGFSPFHGTNEPWTIGTNVSSGCIRLTNEDIVDL